MSDYLLLLSDLLEKKETGDAMVYLQRLFVFNSDFDLVRVKPLTVQGVVFVVRQLASNFIMAN